MVPDFGSVHQAHSGYHFASSHNDAAIKALEASCEEELPQGISFPLLVDMVKKGEISEKMIDRALTRVLKHKARLGLLEKDAALIAEDPLNRTCKKGPSGALCPPQSG